MTALAPCSMAYLIVGTAPTMRCGFVIFLEESSGTLKSTRIRTRLPFRSMSVMESLLESDMSCCKAAVFLVAVADQVEKSTLS